MFQARISTWVVLIILAPSVYVSVNLLVTYLKAVFDWQEAQWQLDFIQIPIPIMFGLFALAVASLSKANRVLIGICVAASTLPCLLFVLMRFHVY